MAKARGPGRRPGPSTVAVHGGGRALRTGDPVAPPIVQSATYRWATPADGELLYTRYGNNPNQLVVGRKIAELEGMVVGTFQLTFIRQLSYGGCLVAQVESVFVSSSARSRGVGGLMMEFARGEAERRGALRIQLTSNVAREQAHRFYERLGYRATHKGMKLYLERAARERTMER